MVTNPLTKYERVILFCKRGIAWLIETGLYNIVIIPIGMVIYLGLKHDAYLSEQARINAIHHGLNAPLTLLVACQIPFYLLRDIVGKGTSLGKRLVGLEVIHVEGHYEIPRNNALMLRNAVMVIPGMVIIEIIVMLFEKKHQRRIGDYFANTIVVLKERTDDYSTWILYLIITMFIFILIGMYALPQLVKLYINIFL